MAGEGFDTDALIIASRRAPQLDPHMHVAVAQNSLTIEDAMTQAGGVAAFGGALTLRSNLEKQDDAIQLRYFRSAPKATQDLLLGAGYRMPTDSLVANVEDAVRGLIDEKKKSSSIVGRIKDTVSDAATATGGFLDKAFPGAGNAVGWTLNEMGRPLRDVQHLFRAAALMTDENVQEGRGRWSLHGVFSPHAWDQAWDESKNGEATFSPVSEEEAIDRWGADIVDVAKMLASGVEPGELVLSVPEENRPALSQFLHDDPDLKAATEFMDAAHISFGRRLVGPELAVSHPALHRALTGGLDAMADWYADPLVVGGKLAKADRIARFAVQDADDIHRLFQATTQTGARVRREAQGVVDALNRGGAGELIAVKPRWSRVAESLQQEGIKTVEQLENYLAGDAGFKALMEHRLTGMHAGVTTMPFQTRFGQMTEMFKNTAAGVIDSRAAGGHVGGMALNRFTTAIPRATRLSATSPDSTVEIGRIARLFLDERTARNVQTLWASTKYVGERRDIYRGLLENLRNATGAAADDPFWQRIMASLDDASASQMYSSIPGRDFIQRGAHASAEGFRLSHRSTSWVVPSYRDMLRAANLKNRLGLNSEIMDSAMNAWKTSVILRPAFALRAGGEETLQAMMRYGPKNILKSMAARSAVSEGQFLPWHPFQHMFDSMTGHMPAAIRDALRTPGDLVGAVLGDNARRAFRYAEGRFAGEVYLNAARRAAESETFRASFERFASAAHQPGGGYLDPIDLGHMVDEGGIVVPARMKATSKWGPIERGASPTSYYYSWRINLSEVAHDPVSRAILREYIDLGPLVPRPPIHMLDASGTPVMIHAGGTMEEAAAERLQQLYDRGAKILGSHNAGQWRTDFARNFVDSKGRVVVRQSERPAETVIRNGRVMPEGTPDPFAKTGPPVGALDDMDHPYWAGPNVEDVLDAEDMDSVDEFRQVFGREPSVDEVSRIGKYSADRGVVPAVETITQEEAWADWARLNVDDTLHLLSSEDGVFNAELAQRLLDGNIPSAVELAAMDDAVKPFRVKGPELLPVHEGEGRIRALVNKSFYEMIGRPMDWLTRQPLMLHNYVVAEAEIAQAAEKMKFKDVAAKEKYIHDASVHRALDETLAGVDDPRLRSQFAVTTRNLIPFWFAQEQFYKRVVRTFLYNPASFRQMQLTMAGFRHMGVLHKDENGDDYFFIPVLGQLTQEFIAEAWKKYTGVDAVLPIPVGFTGQVKMTAPGIDNLGVPSFAPWVGAAVGGIGQRFPEFEPVARSVEGNYARRPMWEMFVPSTVSRIYHAIADSPEGSAQMMSAEMQAMQYLEATGNGPKDDSPQEYEIWKERVVAWARSLAIARTVVGFGAPASPQVDVDPDKLHKEFVELIGELGYEDAFREYIRRHPDATAWTVFPTRSTSGAPLPVTRAAFKYMEKHEELLSEFPLSAGWLLPNQPSKASEYSPEAYREQLALEMRTRKPTLDDIWKDIKFAQAKQTYFDARDSMLKALAETGEDDVARRKQIKDIWKNWSTEYKATHPVFAEALEGPDSQNRREAVLKDLRRAISDPRFPTDRQATHLRTMVDVYDDYRAHMQAIAASAHPGSARNQELKNRYKAIFLGWADKYAEDNPDVDTFYKMMVLPDVDPNRIDD